MGDFWGRRVARLPDRGILLVATDLQGNLGDYEAMKSLYEEEERAGAEPVLLFTGDLVHGPDARTARAWPSHLGSRYEDRSAELIIDYEKFAASARTLCLLGNHEHTHVGGPVVSKFHPDEGAVLEEALGEDRERIRAFIETFPLVAISHCGAVFTHGAPRSTEPDLATFEAIEYRGFERYSTQDMYLAGTLGALLWARAAPPERVRAFLSATSDGRAPNSFVAYGHDVVHEGYEKVGAEQICVSTSFGLADGDKTYLRLDLSARYDSVDDLREGVEILRLYPDRVSVEGWPS